MLHVMASPTMVILMTLVVSFILLDNMYSTGITHYDHHLRLSYLIVQVPDGQRYKLYFKEVTMFISVLNYPSIVSWFKSSLLLKILKQYT